MDQRILVRLGTINRALPFAEPIAQCAEPPNAVFVAPVGTDFDPAAPTMRDLESWRRIDADFLIDGML